MLLFLGAARPLRDSTRSTVARDGADSSPRPDSSWDIRRAPHRGCRRRSSQISASTSADRRVGLFRGRRERSSRPGMPSCSNRRRQLCRVWRDVPYRAATSPIGADHGPVSQRASTAVGPHSRGRGCGPAVGGRRGVSGGTRCRAHAAPATALRADARCRARQLHPDAAGPLPPRLRPLPGAVRPPRRRRGCGPRRVHPTRPPAGGAEPGALTACPPNDTTLRAASSQAGDIRCFCGRCYSDPKETVWATAGVVRFSRMGEGERCSVASEWGERALGQGFKVVSWLGIRRSSGLARSTLSRRDHIAPLWFSLPRAWASQTW